MVISVDNKGTLRRYAGRWITVICRHCDHRHEMRVEELAEKIGWDNEIERARRVRMTCTKCGNRHPALTVSEGRKSAGI